MRWTRGLGWRGRLLAATVVGCGLFAITTAVQASIPDASGVIHGCYNTSLAHGSPTGTLRVVDPSSSNGNCASWEAPLNWGQRGMTGPTGARGLTGSRGPTGATGASGVSLFANVDSDGTLMGGTATAATRTGTGSYRVTFGRNVSNCASVAQSGGFPGFDSATANLAGTTQTSSLSPGDVFVDLQHPNSAGADSAFHLIVAC